MADFRRDNSNKRSSGRFNNDRPKRFSRGDSPRFRGRDSDRFERKDSERSFEKKMHTVTCDKCGERCEVPFRPTEGKPVYCYNCFKKDDNHESKPSKNEFDQINEKLNKIMKKLDIK